MPWFWGTWRGEHMKTSTILMGFVLGASLIGGSALAQQYPNKPVHVIVPFPPGSTDVMVRTMQPVMEKVLGQPLVIENKTGANGYLGTEYVARSKPDGYTTLVTASSSIVMGPLTSKDVPFDVEKDFTFVTDIVLPPTVLVTRASLPVNNLAELIAYAKSKPGQLTFGHPGVGSTYQVLGAEFDGITGISTIPVAYRGFIPMMQALQGGELDFAMVVPALVRQGIQNGQLKLIAIDKGPVPQSLPAVPELTKVLPGFETIEIFIGLWAPANTPKPIIDKLNEAAVAALKTDEVRSRLEDGGVQMTLGKNPEQAQAALVNNVAVTKRLVEAAKAAGVKFD